LDEVDAMPEVHFVRASIRPDNVGSQAVIRGFRFSRIGEQWDADDGLEELWERISPAGAGPAVWG
jgi:hypothetical protein